MENRMEEKKDPASECLTEWIETLQKHKLTVEEMLVVFSNLGYSIGASIQGYTEKGPSQEEVMKMASMDPETPGMCHPDKVGIALMQASITVAHWAWMFAEKENKNG